VEWLWSGRGRYVHRLCLARHGAAALPRVYSRVAGARPVDDSLQYRGLVDRFMGTKLALFDDFISFIGNSIALHT